MIRNSSPSSLMLLFPSSLMPEQKSSEAAASRGLGILPDSARESREGLLRQTVMVSPSLNPGSSTSAPSAYFLISSIDVTGIPVSIPLIYSWNIA